MTNIKVWGRRNSVNVQKVMWAIGEMNLEFRRYDIGGSFGINDNYLKLGLFFYKTKIYNLKKYLVNSANQLGFYSIINNTFEPQDPIEENYDKLMIKYSLLKKKINELVELLVNKSS